jgi:L,D-peptidoglycan transpeptidase YkuD (ErfK/YbiS/YcfS/YnhG family)
MSRLPLRTVSLRTVSLRTVSLRTVSLRTGALRTGAVFTAGGLAALAGCLTVASLGSGALAAGPPASGAVLLSGPARTVGPADSTLPGRIGAQPRVRQMVTVVSDHWNSTTGGLRAWERSKGGDWHKVHGPLPVVLGYAGWVRAADRVQSTGTSPAGRFRLPLGFGNLPNPGTALRYHHVDDNDWWPYEPRDPATYNIYEFHKASSSHWRPDYAEHLTDYQSQYAYAVVVGFNLPKGVHYSAKRDQRVADQPADTKRGGGIFLHVRGAGNTAGCIAMAKTHVEWLLRWLDPAKHPQVVMGPYDYVLTL